MLTVFYLIPKSYGLISLRNTQRVTDVVVRGESVTNDKVVEEFIAAKKEQDTFEDNLLNSSRVSNTSSGSSTALPPPSVTVER